MIQRDLINNRLDAEDIRLLLEEPEVTDNITRYQSNLRYFRGDNPFIMDRTPPDMNSPDNRIPISYGRKIISTVAGYMYKPGLVKFATDNDKYKAIIDEIFEFNEEPLETSQLGTQTSLQGIGFELHYIDGVAKDSDLKVAMPRFTKIPAEQMIPIWDYAIEPNLIACIRHYMKGENLYIHVYYSDTELQYTKEKNKDELNLIGEFPHFYNKVPVVVYQNNEEMVGDFEPIRYLIDAYDVLMSDSMNEFDRFAWAYLLMKGFSLSDEDTQTIKWKRAFENLDVEDAVSFLTKDINSEFIKFMSDWIRDEIHKQSHVPNFLEYRSGEQLSGVAISKALYDFEFIAATKEAYFKRAIMDRFALIDEIIKIRDGGLAGDKNDIEVIMSRNKPMDMKEDAEIFNMYFGKLSEKTLIENFASFVKDADEEMEQKKAEEEEQAKVDLDMFEQRSAIFSENSGSTDELGGRSA